MTVYFATTNPGKLREFNLIAAHHGAGLLEVLSVPGLKEIQPPEETGTTFAANAELKAVYYSTFTGGLVFADDSGLAVDALNGEPGVFSARYAGEHATDAANNARLLDVMKQEKNRRARFVCAMAVAKSGELLALFQDDVEGVLLHEPRGSNGFGYDPLFFYPPFHCTFGEAEPERKLLVSHRGKAMEKMICWILAQA
ncbi:MAG: RdgB/HAM1 family non-canonical purine NTP pyrophosphatase [Acidobacteria bacterium]|nr:RdgB/HAM1 family non-canonical purine NTP pyrophosphatase [Acidobacteriota bacterium]